MRSTILFALIVALLARPPATRGPGQEEKAAARPEVEQPSEKAVEKPAKPEDKATKNSSSKPAAKGSEPIRKD